MVKEKFNPEWYVLRYNRPSKHMHAYNIFNNWRVHHDAYKYCKLHWQEKISYDEFKSNIRSIIFNQMAGRIEYEFAVSSLILCSTKYEGMVDCFMQVEPNLDILCKYLIEYYAKGSRKKKESA